MAAVGAAGGCAVTVQGDVANDADCRKLAATALETFGGIDILVNNAGTTKFATHADLDALDDVDFQRLYAVHVIGAFQMVRVRHGSPADHRQCVVDRRTSRHRFVDRLCRFERRPQHHDQVIGGRAFGRETADRLAADHQKTVPLDRVAQPEGIADVMAFFAGPACRYVTGETLLADGGLHLTVGSAGFR